MEIYVGLAISFCLLIFSVLNNIFIGYMLIACWLLFALIALKRGHTLKDIARMSYSGGRQSFVVLKILVMIGAVIGIWMASGTIPAIVYYCLQYIIPVMPHIFALAAFLICCLTSFLIGTSFGTVSIVGIPLMIIARSGGVNLNIVAGAIIAGAYFGDRCSPMSSSAILVANLTKTSLFTNIRNMLYSSVVPFLLSLVFYYALSVSHPLKAISGNLPGELFKTFNIQVILLLPAILILILSLCKIRIDISILIGILSASALDMLFQNHQLKQVIDYLIFGFSLNSANPLQGIISGGGIVSMLKTCAVIFVSCSLAGIFTGMKIFSNLQATLLGMRLTRHKLFGATSLVSIVAAAFGCSQTIAVVMAKEIMKDCYDRLDSYQLALDLENTGIIICALIPWNIAALVPTTTMGVSAAGYIPFAFYLYILPVAYFIHSKCSSRISDRQPDPGA